MTDFFEEDEIDFRKAKRKDEAERKSHHDEKYQKAKRELEKNGELSLDPNQYYINQQKIEAKMRE